MSLDPTRKTSNSTSEVSYDLSSKRIPALGQLRNAYLTHLANSYRSLELKGLSHLGAVTNLLALEDVYVPLLARPELPAGETWERHRLAGRYLDWHSLPDEALSTLFREKSSPPIQVDEAVRQNNRLVILGDPGSGKTTMLKHIALGLARRPEAPLPVLIPLNAFAHALARGDGDLNNYLSEYYARRIGDRSSLAVLFEDAIQHGQAIFLLDGLDEVQSWRTVLVEKVEQFSHEVVRKGNKIIVTSRIVGYRDAPLAPKEWALFTLLDFSPESIKQFACRWCLAFEVSIHGDTQEAHLAGERECQALLASIESNPSVGRLASNPLLLTILALIKRQGIELPRNRIKLYDRYLETLIEAWNKARTLDITPWADSLLYETTLEVLGPLALRLRQENPTFGLASEQKLLEWLKDYYSGDEWGLNPEMAYQKGVLFLRDVRQYSNLLLERGEGQFGFIHLSFEEALAAYGLVAAGQVDRQRSLEIIQAHLTDPAWYETIRLALGVWGILNRQPLTAGEVLRAILTMQCNGAETDLNVLIAGACLEDVGEQGSGKIAAREVIEALKTTATNRSLAPATQRDAGFILGRLAANSPDFFQYICPDLDDFVRIEPGEFRYGGISLPECTLAVSNPYLIAKYTVTNLQYRRFIEANGYVRKEFWSDEGWVWRTGQYDLTAKIEYQELLKKRPPERRGEPYYWRDVKWTNPLAPVVGVTWFEAEAYCKWLTLTSGDGSFYRLPTEEEWERAARGENGRDYAWGNDYNRDKFNSAAFWNRDAGEDWVTDTNMSSTTIIGQFPEGRTPDGIDDLSGNVWEWTGSWFGEGKINRVVRGASWGDKREKVRCAYRDWLTPVDYVNVIGFRVVADYLGR